MPLLRSTLTTLITDGPSPPGTLGPAPPLQLFSGEFLYYALVFFVLAILAALVGARGVAGVSMEIARIFVVLFVVLAIITLVL